MIFILNCGVLKYEIYYRLILCKIRFPKANGKHFWLLQTYSPLVKFIHRSSSSPLRNRYPSRNINLQIIILINKNFQD